jgi:hypothetical protein
VAGVLPASDQDRRDDSPNVSVKSGQSAVRKAALPPFSLQHTTKFSQVFDERLELASRFEESTMVNKKDLHGKA